MFVRDANYGLRNLIRKCTRGIFFWQNFLGCDKLFLAATSCFSVRLLKIGCDKFFRGRVMYWIGSRGGGCATLKIFRPKKVVTFFFFFWRADNFWEELENF